ncbi:MAG: hypothetical protein WD490_11075 [Opitutales bacterium]
MKSLRFFAFLSLSLSFTLPAAASEPDVLFFEDFEGEGSLDKWKIQSTNEGRVQIAEDPREPLNHGLLMDDGVNDAAFSQNVAEETGHPHLSYLEKLKI